MEAKLPQFSNCCYFIPLKKGLLTLAFINAVIHGLVFAMVSYVAALITVLSLGMAGTFPPIEISFLLPAVTLCILIFYILVIVASLKEDARLLKTLLIFGLGLWVFVALYSFCIAGRLGSILSVDDNPTDQFKLTVYTTFVVSEPFIMGYTLLLLRSLKLRVERSGDAQNLFTNRKERADYLQL